MKLGVDIYSIRSQDWNAFEYLGYCKKIGIDVVHFSDLNPFESTEDSYMKEVKSRADELGLEIEAGMGSICPTSNSFRGDRTEAVEQVKQMLYIAKILESPSLRCFLGSFADRKTEKPLEIHIQATIETCKAVKDMATELGIKLAVENHSGDLQGWELKMLIEEAGPEYVGACIDTGNPLSVLEDPVITLKHLAPYVVTSHIRDGIVWPHPKGAAVQWVAMGDGNIGIEDWAERYKVQCPDAPFTLEIITGRPPRVLNYLEEDFWSALPNAKASEFARFERLVRNGLPFMGDMVIVGEDQDIPDEYKAAQIAQQRFDLERSVKYCREALGVGE